MRETVETEFVVAVENDKLERNIAALFTNDICILLFHLLTTL